MVYVLASSFLGYSLLVTALHVTLFSNTLIVIIKTSPLLIFFEGTFAPKKSLVYNRWLSRSSQLEEKGNDGGM